jgi:CBS domain-containing protein
MNVGDVMTRSPSCSSRETPLREVSRMMVECDCGMIPVVDEENKPIGTITDRDIVVRAVADGRNPLELSARDCMTDGCVTVTQEMSLEECVDALEKHRIRRAIVVDEQGRVCGIVAQADIARRDEDLGGEVVEAVSREGGSPAPLH